MKKLFTILALFVVAIGANAQNNVKIQDATVQAGTQAELTVLLSNEDDVDAFSFVLDYDAAFEVVMSGSDPKATFPDLTSVTSSKSATQLSAGVLASAPIEAGEDVAVGKLYFTAPSTPGVYEVTVNNIGFVVAGADVPVAGEYTAIITVQRPEVFEPFSSAYLLEVIPFEMEKTVTYDAEGEDNFGVSLKMANGATVKSVEFDVYLSNGISLATVEEENPDFDPDDESMGPEFLNVYPFDMATGITNTGAISSTEVSKNTDGSYHVAITMTKGWITKSTSSREIATIYPVATDLLEGVYKMSLKNAVITRYNNDPYAGEYIASIFVGEAKEETDPILYGHFTDEAMPLLNKLTDAKTVDMSVATVDNEAQATVNDALVYVGGKTKYSRAKGTSTYGTICLPIELTSDANIQYYTISDATSESLTLSAAETVPANKPAIFEYKSDEALDASAEGTVYAVAPEAGDGFANVTLTGVYQTYPLPAGAGYYIAGDKFWNDGATVKPYRAFLDGEIFGVKALRIQIEDETGIRDITDELDSDAIYDLSGRKLDKVRKGVNIVSGKKILVK